MIDRSKVRARKHRYYLKCKRAFESLGLTTKGTQRQRRPKGQAMSLEEIRERRLIRWRGYAAKRVASGLTTKGKVRKKNWMGKPVDHRAIRWQQFKELDVISVDFVESPLDEQMVGG